jgi:hypothetical protein
MTYYPVSTLVNAAKNDSQACIVEDKTMSQLV